jgi:hypothetical protein
MHIVIEKIIKNLIRKKISFFKSFFNNFFIEKCYGVALKKISPLNMPEISIPKDELLIINELKHNNEITNCIWNNHTFDIFSRDIKTITKI